jgi:butyrate kinase
MGYKVVFENNIAVSATEVEKASSMNDFVEFGNDQERTVIRSLYIEAANEADAITHANGVVKRIWGDILGVN